MDTQGTYFPSNESTSRLKFPCIYLLALSLLLTASASASTTSHKIPIQLLSKIELTNLESRLSSELQRVASGKHFEDQTQEIHLVANFELSSGRLTVDLGQENGHRSISAEMEDLHRLLGNTASIIIEEKATFQGIDFIYGGKDLYYYFPEEWQAPRPIIDSPSSKKSTDSQSL